MGASALLALLGLGLLFVLPDTGDIDADSETPEEPSAPDAPTPDEIEFTGETLGTDGPDRILFDFADPTNLQFDLGAGSDRVQAGSGNDLISGGAGEDFLRAGPGDDLISGGDGDDVLWGSAGDDTIFGGAGNDDILDTLGSNTIDGGLGDDTIRFRAGSTVTGGDGSDDYNFSFNAGTDDGPSRITDFNPDEDTLLELSVQLPDGSEGGVVLAERADQSGVDFRLGARTILAVDGAEASDLEDVSISFHVDEFDTATGSLDDDNISVFGAATVSGGAGDDDIKTSTPARLAPSVLNGDDGNDTLNAFGPTIFENGDGIDTTVRSILNGGDGDDLVSVVYIGILTGGEGADRFSIESPLVSSTFTEITDFDPTHDTLFVSALDSTVDDFNLVVWDDNTGSDLFQNDQRIARITGGQTLTVSDIVLGVPEDLFD